MSHDFHSDLPKKKPSVLWWIAGLLLLVLVFFFVQLFGPNPPIVVSKQTTYITGPLLPDGLPDYEAHVLETAREGVTPQNNAAVFMWQALGPGRGAWSMKPGDWEVLCEELEMPSQADETSYLAPLYSPENRERIGAWLEAQSPPTDSDADASPAETEGGPLDLIPEDDGIPTETLIDMAFDQVMERPWTSVQLPPLAEWIAENQRQIELLVEGSKKSRAYSPSPSLLNGTDDSLLGMSFESIQQARDVARIISVRAMWQLGEGRHEESWNDIMAIYRWGRLVGQGGLLIDQLVAVAIDGMADRLTQNLLSDPRLSPELARQIQRDLLALPPTSRMADCFDKGERLFVLDIMVRCSQDGLGSIFSDIAGNASTQPLDFTSVDWNVVLRTTNDWYDRVAAASRMPTYAARSKALNQFDADIQQLFEETRNPKSWLGGLLSRRQRSDLLAAIALGLSMPAMQAATEAEDRAKARMELTRLAAALAVYRAEHGQYPDTLDALVPDVLPKLLVDFHHAKPFIYRRDGEGYLLYSTGANGQDDRGSNEIMSTLEGRNLNDLPGNEHEQQETKIPAGADDFSIRVPLQPFQLPQPAEAE